MREQYAPQQASITKRDEWSLTFEDILDLDKPRTDCPTKLPDVPKGPSEDPEMRKMMNNKPLTSMQRTLLYVGSGLCGAQDWVEKNWLAEGKHVKQNVADKFLKDCVQTFIKKGGNKGLKR